MLAAVTVGTPKKIGAASGLHSKEYRHKDLHGSAHHHTQHHTRKEHTASFTLAICCK
jgi:hypothetical protein